LVRETPSSGNAEADLMATLFRLSDDDIEGCLKLVENYSLDFIKDVMTYWSGLKVPYEERTKQAKQKIEQATQQYLLNNNNQVTSKDGKVFKFKINPLEIIEKERRENAIQAKC
jgi:hypothetical protein